MKDKKIKKRIDWIDCAKGIAIILVIIGHTVTFGSEPEKITRGIIFSFHMPLFFILSFMTSSFSKDTMGFCRKLKKSFFHLIIPVFIIYGIIITIHVINNHNSIEWKSYTASVINSLVFSSGVDVKIAGATIPALGILWFLVVLFIGRAFIDFLHLKLGVVPFLILCGLCSTAGLMLAKIQWLPLSLDIMMAIIPLFLFGIVLKKIDISRLTVLWLIISLIVWGGAFAYVYYFHGTYLELAIRRYPIFPVCYIAAIAGTMFVSYLSFFITKLGYFGKAFVWIGRNSIYLYIVHALDSNISFLWSNIDNIAVSMIIKLAVDIGLCIILANVVHLISGAINNLSLKRNNIDKV